MLVVKLVPRGVRPTTAEDNAVKVLNATVEPEREHIARVLVQFDELIDKAGNELLICRAKVTLAKALHVPTFHLEGRAETKREAAELVSDAILGAVRRALAAGKRGRTVEREVEAAAPPEAAGTRRRREPRISAHPPRGQGFHMTRRQSHATAAREEESAAHPSRKSTRKSANRSKRFGNITARTGKAVRPVRPEARR